MSKRELIDTGTDKRDVRRDKDGKFKKASMSRKAPDNTFPRREQARYGAIWHGQNPGMGWPF